MQMSVNQLHLHTVHMPIVPDLIYFHCSGGKTWFSLQENYDLEEHSFSCKTITWSIQWKQGQCSGVAYSNPDLNPIENLWLDLKSAVYVRSLCSLPEPKQFCKEWNKIAASRCATLIETYPHGLSAVIEAKRGSILITYFTQCIFNQLTLRLRKFLNSCQKSQIIYWP